MKIRSFQDSDITQVVSLFYDTVHSVNAIDYTTEQLDVWAPKEDFETKLETWKKSLNKNITYIAEVNDKIVGFTDMTHDGYLDRLYIHKDYQRRGISTALMDYIESVASNMGLSEIYTEASITAKSFFEHRGFKVIKSQTIVRDGVTLPNFKMSKKYE